MGEMMNLWTDGETIDADWKAWIGWEGQCIIEKPSNSFAGPGCCDFGLNMLGVWRIILFEDPICIRWDKGQHMMELSVIFRKPRYIHAKIIARPCFEEIQLCFDRLNTKWSTFPCPSIIRPTIVRPSPLFHLLAFSWNSCLSPNVWQLLSIPICP